ncbi:SDR family oxidoreductase [Lacisediminimonas sp.]|uniref:dTDP-4-dehydrorhamnose reductase family protein n=1 Tax=Lacisediminimonas sp. TaxID=3060582 RepID=UPI0027167B87|nr:SDR family oxidoreductase [Lacisediminimonas sp.]MDO8298695.1 SDR family oxidoreductase [Lacisediminimonas sp.]
MRILILGASGMLGNAMMRRLSVSDELEVYGSVRSASMKKYFDAAIAKRIITGLDVENADALTRAFLEVRPQVVINCIGLVKQFSEAEDPLVALPINAMLPHRLARLSALAGARFIHISTDCVFSGRKGGYRESDESDAQDVYGRSKFLGEVHYPHCVTLRTSIIGHELNSTHGLIGWFLSQKGPIKGYTRAVFSGLSTCELATVIKDFVLPARDLTGLYHVAAEPITKYDLLKLAGSEYGHAIPIEPDDRLVIDRSLDASRFNAATGYVAPPWPDLVKRMRDFG